MTIRDCIMMNCGYVLFIVSLVAGLFGYLAVQCWVVSISKSYFLRVPLLTNLYLQLSILLVSIG